MISCMKTSYYYIGLIVLIIVGLVLVKQLAPDRPSNGSEVVNTEIDSFAQCIADAGAKFYGAYWCPHCQAQKKLFSNSKKLPYVECSLPDGKTQTKECAALEISGYPTWILADGTRLDGEQTFETLAEKTSCVAPPEQEPSLI